MTEQLVQQPMTVETMHTAHSASSTSSGTRHGSCSLPRSDRRQPGWGRRGRHRLLAILAAGMLAASCGTSPDARDAGGTPSPRPGRSQGWYAASPAPTHNRGKEFVFVAGSQFRGSRRHVLAVGHHICRTLSATATTITPLTAQLVADGDAFDSVHAEQGITDAVTLLCAPIHRTRAEQTYLDAVAALDNRLTAHPDLTIHRGHDICYLLGHHTPDAAALIARRHLYATATTANKLITITRRDLCPR